MRIGYFTSKYPYRDLTDHVNYSYGGSVLATDYLTREIVNMGYEVDVFTTSSTFNDTFEEQNDIRVHRYGTLFHLQSSNISLNLHYKTLNHDVDLVHVSFDIPPAPLAGLRYARKKDLPLVLTHHGDWDANYGGLLRRAGVIYHNAFLVEKILSYADVIISPSKTYSEKSNFLTKYCDKITVIPNGINLEEYDTRLSKEECRELLGLPLGSKVILFFGYLTPYKGPDVLLRAVKSILSKHPNTLLIFVGQGMMREELDILSRQLGIVKNVRFEGYVENSKKKLYFRSADVYVLPSMESTECYPLTILEAMACGVPVVASNAGGIPDAVTNGQNGLLVPPKDPKALAEAIQLLLQSDEVALKLSICAQKNVARYSWKNIAEKTSKIYRNIHSNLS